MEEVKIISMDEASIQGYQHSGETFMAGRVGREAALASAQFYCDNGKDYAVVQLRIAKEWGGAIVGYALAYRGKK